MTSSLLDWCSLGVLNLSSNFVRNLKELKVLLDTNRGLQRLWVGDNPLCHTKRFRDNIIVMSNSLRVREVMHAGPPVHRCARIH